MRVPIHRDRLENLVLAGASSAFLLFGMALIYAETGTMGAPSATVPFTNFRICS